MGGGASGATSHGAQGGPKALQPHRGRDPSTEYRRVIALVCESSSVRETLAAIFGLPGLFC